MKRMCAKLWVVQCCVFFFFYSFCNALQVFMGGEYNIKYLLFQSQPGTVINKIKTQWA